MQASPIQSEEGMSFATGSPDSSPSEKRLFSRSRSAGSKRLAAVSSASAAWSLSALSKMFNALGSSATASMSIRNLTMNQNNPFGRAGRVSSFHQSLQKD